MTTWAAITRLRDILFWRKFWFLIFTFEYRREMCWICHWFWVKLLEILLLSRILNVTEGMKRE
jgi:hypothetical protein